jgi:DNA ligase-associated metallophosphoesterase
MFARLSSRQVCPMHTAMPIEFAGETLHLLPQRAVYWPRERVLFVADTHFGKASAFRASAVPVPGPAILAEELARLTQALAHTTATRLVILGDLLHAYTSHDHETRAGLMAWRAQHPALDVRLVRGNHDRHAGDPPAELGIACADEPFALPPFVLCHFPEHAPQAAHTLAGHVHPAARLVGSGSTLKLPCFWRRGQVLVLPAFSGFVDHALIVPAAGDGVYVVAEDQVLAVHAPRPAG